MGSGVNLLELNNGYLQSEIRQVAILVRGQLRGLLAIQREPGDPFKGLYISNQDIQDIQNGLGDEARTANLLLTEDEVTALSEALSKAQEESQQIEKQADQQGILLNLQKIQQYFNLSGFEYAAFLFCLLPALDLRYERVYGFLQDDVTKKNASVDLILRLLEHSSNMSDLAKISVFSANGTLIKYHLLRPIDPPGVWLEPRLSQRFEVPPALVAWLLGEYFPEESWLNLSPWPVIADYQPDTPSLASFELDWVMVREKLPLLAFDGPDQEFMSQAARMVAKHFQMPILEINLDEVCKDRSLPISDLRLIIRDACLQEAVVILRGWDLVLNSDGFVPTVLLEEITDFVGLIILCSHSAWRLSRDGGRPALQVHFTAPDSAERAAIWKEALGEETRLTNETIQTLSSQFILTGSQIRNAVFCVNNRSDLSGQPYSAEDLFIAARQQSTHHLGQLAQKIEARYGWGDIVLPPSEIAILRDIVSMMRYRSVVLEDWGLGEKLAANRGLSALFTGEPGTGKTLAAQVVAGELKLDLYRVDLSNVVSKYIGETEKNLEKIFEEARDSNAVLFFDEADALFGKRSEVKDAHDRYANIEVGYLLQRMETHDGITILATNLSANMDDAFTRRLNHIVHFPFPDEAQRLAIWKVLKPKGLPVEPDIDWEYLATAYPIAGGNIRNILVSAAYLAAQDGRVVRMDQILQATRREMQKMGRLIREDDYQYRRRSTSGKTI